jgi:hypothetical protein
MFSRFSVRQPTVFESAHLPKKFGRPLFNDPTIPETPRRTAVDNQHRARQQGRLPVPVPVESGREALRLIPVEAARPRPQPQVQDLQRAAEQRPQPQRVPVSPILVPEVEEVEDEEPEIEEAPKSAPLPVQPARVATGSVFVIPQQQQQPSASVRPTAQTDYPRRFEPFTPSPDARQLSGDFIQ